MLKTSKVMVKMLNQHFYKVALTLGRIIILVDQNKIKEFQDFFVNFKDFKALD